ncbi:GMC family oxidoreductase [Tumebacillus permanentifrigoris]|uniref:Choline dehydrogenase-like flavoprotein n=1 Tax=Tumebacillus permanentifrigoris TaxID=378543 RepID=A0A316DAB8_9BACL|nr:GMC family oxidoreductase [Tumebacillus permanentifrigoris]PWK13441.1 choline dehydrogenase-like flavoprotein [Tumebacillus permanentifrigoris]
MHEQDPIHHNVCHYDGYRYDDLNHRKYPEDADVVIVGAGTAGGIMAYELARSGLKVVVIEAGPFWNPQSDFASDELSMQHLGWQDTRIVDGTDPLRMGKNNSGRGVGGGSTHWTGVFLRFHESDFRMKTVEGIGADWPITYDDLEPFYRYMEKEIAVSGPKHFPWGAFRGPYPYPERDPLSANAEMFRIGCEQLGIRSVVTPLAINSAPFDGRPPCINRGFCNEGCMPNAKYSSLVHHVPKAIGHGAEFLTDCMVTQIELDAKGRAQSVIFNHDGVEYRQRGRVIVLASYAVETPRLLLASATTGHPDGLCNSSGTVGKYLMTHSSNDVYGRFEQEIRLYKGTPVLATTQDFYETQLNRGFVRGYTLHAHGARPVAMGSGLAREAGIWGRRLRETMLNYNFYGRITMVGEVLPAEQNAVTLADERDEYGMPMPKVTFSYGENDRKLIDHAVVKMQEILKAAGGTPEFVVSDTAHLMGGTRMGSDPATSVVNGWCQAHDIPNLFICSAAVFPTSGSGNPTATVMALAARTAAHLKDELIKQHL